MLDAHGGRNKWEREVLGARGIDWGSGFRLEWLVRCSLWVKAWSLATLVREWGCKVVGVLLLQEALARGIGVSGERR